MDRKRCRIVQKRNSLPVDIQAGKIHRCTKAEKNLYEKGKFFVIKVMYRYASLNGGDTF